MFVQHPHQAGGEVGGRLWVDIDGRLARGAGLAQLQVGEIGLAAGATAGFRYVELEWKIVVHVVTTLDLVFVGAALELSLAGWRQRLGTYPTGRRWRNHVQNGVGLRHRCIDHAQRAENRSDSCKISADVSVSPETQKPAEAGF
jgi:hypothetical protein